MKIALVLSASPGYSETFFTNKISVLHEAGTEIQIFTDVHTSNSPFPYKSGINPRGGKWHPRNVSALLKAIRQLVSNAGSAIRLYHANQRDGETIGQNLKSLLTSAHILGSGADWIYFGFATVALNRENLASAIGAKMAVSIRGYDMEIYPLKDPGCYDRLWKKADKLHYISDHLLSLAEKHGLPSTIERTKITPAIDTTLFKPIRPLPEIRKAKVRFLTIARLTWKKGLIYTLRALSILKKKGFEFTYSIVGSGSERERIIYAIHEMGLEDNVRLYGQAQPELIRHMLSETDIYIQFSVQEGFSNAVLEAQAMGCLCVVSDAGGLPENVLDGRTGWVVRSRDSRALAEKIIEVLNLDKNSQDQIREQAIQRVQEQFDLVGQKQKFLDFYRID